MIKRRSESGFTYIEIMITIGVVAVSLVPIMESIRTSIIGSEKNQNHIVQRYHNFAKMEEVLAESFARLSEEATETGSETIPTSYSDDVSAVNRRRVYLSYYDMDNADADNDPFTGTEQAIWIKTEIINSDQSLESLVIP